MGTVEELQATLLHIVEILSRNRVLTNETFGKLGDFPHIVDSLITVAEARGVEKGRAEGAEEMKVTIKDAGWPLDPIPDCDEWVVPLHKLAPKEKS